MPQISTLFLLQVRGDPTVPEVSHQSSFEISAEADDSGGRRASIPGPDPQFRHRMWPGNRRLLADMRSVNAAIFLAKMKSSPLTHDGIDLMEQARRTAISSTETWAIESISCWRETPRPTS